MLYLINATKTNEANNQRTMTNINRKYKKSKEMKNNYKTESTSWGRKTRDTKNKMNTLKHNRKLSG